MKVATKSPGLETWSQRQANCHDRAKMLASSAWANSGEIYLSTHSFRTFQNFSLFVNYISDNKRYKNKDWGMKKGSKIIDSKLKANTRMKVVSGSD
jgi:hypothetical protein